MPIRLALVDRPVEPGWRCGLAQPAPPQPPMPTPTTTTRDSRRRRRGHHRRGDQVRFHRHRRPGGTPRRQPDLHRDPGQPHHPHRQGHRRDNDLPREQQRLERTGLRCQGPADLGADRARADAHRRHLSQGQRRHAHRQLRGQAVRPAQRFDCGEERRRLLQRAGAECNAGPAADRAAAQPGRVRHLAGRQGRARRRGASSGPTA